MNTSKNGLLIGRWQTLHEGHDWLVREVQKRGLRPVMAIRNVRRDDNNPNSAGTVMSNIIDRYGHDVDVIAIPDIHSLFYGRDVGYGIVELTPPDDIRQISGSSIRAKDKNKPSHL